MNPLLRLGVFIHDMVHILSADADACDMFRCGEQQLIGRSLLDFVPEDFHHLTRLRLRATLMGRGSIAKPQSHDFLRCDGTSFCAEVSTRSLGNGRYETTVKYKYEIWM